MAMDSEMPSSLASFAASSRSSYSCSFASLLSKKLGQTAHAMPYGRYAGAYGAALLARDHDSK
jgi:hypothetical protein